MTPEVNPAPAPVALSAAAAADPLGWLPERVPARPEPPPPLPGATVGTLASVDGAGVPWVELAGEQLAARTTVPLCPADAGRAAVLLFEDGDRGKPIVVGLLQAPVAERPPMAVQVDGVRQEITAREELVLRCGAASITLTKAGKVLLRGTYVLSRSSGTNRIKGGSVQIN